MNRPLTAILEDIAQQGVPADVDLWPAIREQVRSRIVLVRRRTAMPTALGWACLTLALLLVVGSILYAAPPLIERVLQHEAALSRMEQTAHVQTLNLIRAMEGITVTLRQVYLDTSYIAASLIISHTGAQPYVPHLITLTTAAGVVLPRVIEYSLTKQADFLTTEYLPNKGGYLFAFDGTSLRLATPTLELRLELDLRQARSTPAPLDGLATPDKQLAEPPHVPRSSAKLVGPFTFDFGIPSRPFLQQLP